MIKRKPGLKLLALAAALLVLPRLGLAIDAPHNAVYSIQCLSCHQPHKSLGNNLTRAEMNPLVCQGCHNSLGIARFFPMQDSVRAVPGVSGNSHFWEMAANNPKWGASVPPGAYSQNADADMDIRLDKTNPNNPKVICSTCHNQHDNSNRWGRIHLSSVERTAGSGSTGSVTYAAVDHGARPQGYAIKIVQGGGRGAARYIISDGSLDYSGYLKWYGWDGTQWIAFDGGTAQASAAASARTTGAGQQLRDGGNLTITFVTSSAEFKTGDEFKFYVGYPFFRRAHDNGPGSPVSRSDVLFGPQPGSTYFCRNCHSQRAQSHLDVENWTGTPRSHPVGQALGSNGKGYDRAVPLDANRRPQSSAYPGSPDGNWTNDLLLYRRGTSGSPVYPTVAATAFGNPESGDVQCMTCHAPHFADSNSKTVDKR